MIKRFLYLKYKHFPRILFYSKMSLFTVVLYDYREALNL